MLLLSSIAQNRFRVVYLTTGFVGSVLLAWLFLAPKSKAAGGDYKFMHCKTCRAERKYETSFAEMKCLKCTRENRDGSYVPTVASVGTSGAGPWKWFNVALAVEVILFLGLLAYALERRAATPEVEYLYCNCPYCRWRLRFKETSAGKDGMCPRCGRKFRFPEADAADVEEQPVG